METIAKVNEANANENNSGRSALSEVARHDFTHVDRAFHEIKICLHSDKTYSYVYRAAWHRLSDVVQKRPELADKLFEVCKISLQADKDRNRSSSLVYKSLSSIAKVKPELIGDVLDLCKSNLEGDNKAYAQECIDTITRNNPDAVKKYMETSGKNTQAADVFSLTEKVRNKLHQKDQPTEVVTPEPKEQNTTNVVLANKGKSGYGD